MKVLFVSLSAPPQNTPESLQTGKYIANLADKVDTTLVTIKDFSGWRSADPTIKQISNVKEIRLPHFSSRARKAFATIFNSRWLTMPDEDYLFHWQWKRVVKKYKQTPDIIYSRSTPFSSALLGLKLKKYYKVPWVMHLSDPWTVSPFFTLTGNLQASHHAMESMCFQFADAITLTSKAQIEVYRKAYPQYYDKFQFYPNVFDDSELVHNPVVFNGDLIFLHAGNFYGPGRNPVYFLEAVKLLLTKNAELFKSVKIIFLGRMNKDVRESILRFNFSFVKILEDYTFQDSVNYQRNAHVLLLFDWLFEGVPSMFFLSKILGYMTSQRPILAITGNDSVSYRVIEGKYGRCFEHNDTIGIAEFVEQTTHAFRNSDSTFFHTEQPDNQYSANYNVNRLMNLFERLTEKMNVQ